MSLLKISIRRYGPNTAFADIPVRIPEIISAAMSGPGPTHPLEEIKSRLDALTKAFTDTPDPNLNEALTFHAQKGKFEHQMVVCGLLSALVSTGPARREGLTSMTLLLKISRSGRNEVLSRELLRLLDGDRFEKLPQPSRIKAIDVLSASLSTTPPPLFEPHVMILARQMVGLGFRGPEGIGYLGELGPRTLSLIETHFDWIVSRGAEVVAGLIYNFLGMLHELEKIPQLSAYKSNQAKLCGRLMNRTQIHWRGAGRDVIRALIRVRHISPLDEVWRDTVEADGGNVLSSALLKATEKRVLVARVSPCMVWEIMQMFKRVHMGQQGRHQKRYSQKFFRTDASECLRADLVRFICGAYHPSNRVIASTLLPRWAQLGWLYATVKSNRSRIEIMQAVVWDFYFFQRADKVMNIEPAALLLARSVPKYPKVSEQILNLLTLPPVPAPPTPPPKFPGTNIVLPCVSVALKTLLKVGVFSARDLLKVLSTPNIDQRVKKTFQSAFPRLLSPSSPSPSPPLGDEKMIPPLQTPPQRHPNPKPKERWKKIRV
ncbi:hypothetical protein AAMO2058_000128300 [Amorphochlora amoebiformis]